MLRNPRARALRWRAVAISASASVLAALLALGPSAAPAAAAYAQIEGSGSTWSKVILDQWIADVNPLGIKVSYNGVGSSAGRKDFANKANDFAISEIPYQGTDEQGNADNSNGRAYAYMPIVAGGTAFTYHLESGGQLVRDIRLSGDTIAKIFTNQITRWDDPQIKADNNGRSFPATPIIPVVRSDGSGTTAQFTTWLDKAHPDVWRPYFGRSGLTSYYPKKGGRMVAAAGSDQVMNTIAAASGNGSVGYVEYSYPINKKYPVVKVLNAAGYYVEPTQYNVAVALTRAKINEDPSSPLYLTQILDDVYSFDDPRAYPLSSYSYMILPTGADDPRMTTNKRQALVDLMFYSLCEGQGKAGPYGYSPLPLNLVQAGFQQLAKLKAADPKVDLQNRDATKCNNSTFDGQDLNRNRLAEVAPQPAACDKQGQGPCAGGGVPGPGNGGGSGGGTGGGGTGSPGAPDGAAADGAADGAAAGAAAGGAAAGVAGGGTGTGGAGTGDGATPATGDAGGAPEIDPITGELIDAGAVDEDGGSGDVAASGAVSTNLGVREAAGKWVFGSLVIAELLGLAVLPGLLALRNRQEPGR